MGTSNSSCGRKKKSPLFTPIPADATLYNTRLADSQIMLLKEKFCAYGPNGSLDFTAFCNLLGPNLSKQVVRSVFHLFTQGNAISWKELCSGYCRYILASHSEQADFLVRIFCPPDKVSLAPKQLKALRQFVTGTYKVDKTPKQLDAWIKAGKSLPIEEIKNWAVDCLRLRLALHPLELIPLPRTESDQVKELFERYNELKLGERWCVMSAQWVNAWKRYVQFNEDPMAASIIYFQGLSIGERPIEINNAGLLQDAFQLREGLIRGRDFELVPLPVWEVLFNWYDGGPKIVREVVLQDDALEIELYPLVIQVSADALNPKTAVTLQISKTRLVAEIVMKSAEALKVPFTHDLKLYHVSEANYCLLQSGNTLGRLNGVITCVLTRQEYQGTILADELNAYQLGDQVELRQSQRWVSCIVRDVTSTHYVLTTGSSTFEVSKDQTDELRPSSRILCRNPHLLGANGLINIGNTCYAAVILQVLAHTPLLGDFFASRRYINCLNSAARKDQSLCKAVADTLQRMQSQRGPVKPSGFIVSLTQKHQQFRGLEQQDSHELLRVLLDSLHEELVRSPQAGGMDPTCSVENATQEQTELVAQDQWKQMQGKSGSAVSDLCVGQIRRTLTCPQCRATVQVFERFMDLSLPLPVAPTTTARFVSQTAVNIRVLTLSHIDSLERLYSRLETHTGVLRSQLLAAHVKDKLITRFIDQPESLADLEPPENQLLYFYQVFGSVEEAEAASKPTRFIQPDANWRETLSYGQLVDVKFQGFWVASEVIGVQDEMVRVRLYLKNGIIRELSRSHKSLSSYRSRTSNQDEVLHLPLVMKWGGEHPVIFGHSLVLSIGNWTTWQDFDQAVLRLCSKYVNIEYTEERLYSVSLNLRLTHACALCGIASCMQNHFDQFWESLSWLTARKDIVYVLVHWKTVDHLKQPKLRNKEEAARLTLADCFRELTAVESIARECRRCGSPSMDSCMQICQLPDILILHLKRFSYREGQYVKVRNFVLFPTESLDMSEWSLVRHSGDGCTVDSAAENFQFNLYSVVNHLGTLEKGHYTATCLNSQNVWLSLNDEYVYRFTQAREVVTSDAYVLFYRRKRFTSSNVIGLAL